MPESFRQHASSFREFLSYTTLDGFDGKKQGILFARFLDTMSTREDSGHVVVVAFHDRCRSAGNYKYTARMARVAKLN